MEILIKLLDHCHSKVTKIKSNIKMGKQQAN